MRGRSNEFLRALGIANSARFVRSREDMISFGFLPRPVGKLKLVGSCKHDDSCPESAIYSRLQSRDWSEASTKELTGDPEKYYRKILNL